ncbi:MAG: type II secretion system GspH family protein [Alphaproteobacteria bacterium]|nr:type II secretion system GspH family protein [Alphaproteobacteria bacterium]
MPHIHKRTRGFTLMEAAIVLGIIGLITAGIWVAAAAVLKQKRVTESYGILIQISQNMRALYEKHPYFSRFSPGEDITVPMRQAGVFPADLFASAADNVPRNPWNTPISITVGPSTGVSPPHSFIVTFEPVLAFDDCAKLVLLATGPSGPGGIDAVIMNGGPTIEAVDADNPNNRNNNLRNLTLRQITGCRGVGFRLRL